MPLIPGPFIGKVASRSKYANTSLEIKLVTTLTTITISGTSRLGVRSNGVITESSSAPPDPALTITLYYGANGVKVGSGGSFFRSTFVSLPSRIRVVSGGGFADPLIFSTDPTMVKVGSEGTLYLGATAPSLEAGDGVASVIKWSDIGHLDFTQGRDNVAGERPLDWRGSVYSIVKFRGKVLVLGAGGASFLHPAGNSYGLETFYRVGLKGVKTYCGDESKYFFIDSDNKLWKLTDSLELLDYSEYLSTLAANLVMSYDKVANMVYMSDATNGYVFDVVSGSLGKGPATITGIEYQNRVQYITASADIVIPTFEICTDIYDFGLRSGKTIYWVEFGTDLTNALYAAVDYRRSKASDFVTTPWYLVPANGRVHIRAYGAEFRFRAKLLTYQYFELDYIRVNGVSDDY